MRCLFLFGLLIASPLFAQDQSEPSEIPLDQIWGYNLPGTKDVSGIPLPRTDNLEPLRRQREHSIEQMRRALMVKPPLDRAQPGFIVARQPGFYTLRVSSQLFGDTRIGSRARAINKSFPAGDELTLVFFSHPTSYYVRLKKVEQRNNRFTVYYQFEPHATAEVTVHFALISLGKPPAGEYHVDYERIVMERKYLDDFKVVPDASIVVCQPFSFAVFEPPKEEPPAEGATLIPLDQIWAHDMPGTRNIRKIESQPEPGRVWRVDQSPLVLGIFKSLHQFLKAGEKVGPAFIVVGTDKEALMNANTILAKQAEPATVFPPNTDLTLVFYCYTSGRYVWIDSVERSETLTTVKYRFVSHRSAESTTHFALIPLGKLSEGTFQVKTKQLPPTSVHGARTSPVREPHRIVCESFSFGVGKVK